MGWQETEGTKPPLAYDDEKVKERVPKQDIQNELAKMRDEILTGILEEDLDAVTAVPKPIVTIFDSSKDNK